MKFFKLKSIFYSLTAFAQVIFPLNSFVQDIIETKELALK